MNTPETRLPLPNLDYLKTRISYNKRTGLFKWKTPPKTCKAKRGDVAGGYTSSGHIQIRIDGTKYFAHRLAWLYITGKDPGELEIDHENRKRDDNRACNIRLANRPLQAMNKATSTEETQQKLKLKHAELDCLREEIKSYQTLLVTLLCLGNQGCSRTYS